MPKYDSTLLKREDAAERTMAVYVSKPEGYTFRPGQHCFIEVPDRGYHDERGLRRHFSIASSPAEPHLLFAMNRSESALKRTLSEMPPGAPLSVEGPLGSFALPEETEEPLVFLAGGIGITPFRSMTRHIAEAGTGHRVTLFYSNRKPEEAVFLDELEELARTHDDLRVVATMTRMHTSSLSWEGLTGRVDADLIRDRCPEWAHALHFVAGPPPMVEAMKQTLVDMGVASTKICAANFTGY